MGVANERLVGLAVRGVNVRCTVARARGGGVVPTPGITTTPPARGEPHPGHHGDPGRPGVRISRPGVSTVTLTL